MAETGMSILTKKIVDGKILGESFEDIAANLRIPVEDVLKEWKKYVSARVEIPKEEQWLLMLMRLEDLLVRANLKLEYSTELKDFETVLGILDRLEQLMSLNMSRKEVAQAEADKMYQLQGEQLLNVLEVARLMMTGMIEEAFQKHKTLKAAKADLIGQLADMNDKALERLESND